MSDGTEETGSGGVGSAAEWEPDAERWIEWARADGFDAYWYYRDAFFDEVLPSPGRRTLEVGCGEGRVARDLGARGHAVVAVEPAVTLLRAARSAGARESYVVGAGAALPFHDAVFDVVVAYNVLQVVDDLQGTLAEIARLLAAGGCLCACIAHPVTDLGDVVDASGQPRLAVRSDYFESRRVDESVELGGRAMTFRGRTYSLEHYSIGLERAGLQLVSMREPRPDSATGVHARWRIAPVFLNFRAVKP